MIRKDADKRPITNKLMKSGYDAEKQMAFYLKRAFQNRKDVHVINDLRLELDGDAAQMDHLVIHKFGFIIIESKSVTTKISINDHGEWIRHFNGRTSGMPSPINQAKRQAELLKGFLISKEEQLIRKKSFFKGSFADFNFDVLVAISDRGIISRPKNSSPLAVKKADQITDTIDAIIAGFEATNKKLFSLKTEFHFADETLDKIARHLVLYHQPKAANSVSAAEPVPAPFIPEPIPAQTLVEKPAAAPPPVHACKKCGSEEVAIMYGRYGYYFKCQQCDGNTAIKLSCTSTTCKPRLRKAKLEFFQECTNCDTSTLYFTNTASAE